MTASDADAGSGTTPTITPRGFVARLIVPIESDHPNVPVDPVETA